MKRDPNARTYTDLALTPVTDDDSEELFVTSAHHHAHAHAKPALVTLGLSADAGATVASATTSQN